MKKITNEEMEKITFVTTFSEKRQNPVRLEISVLEIGENLLVSKEDWQNTGRKTPLAVLIGSGFRDGKKFRCKLVSDKSGWVVTRIR